MLHINIAFSRTNIIHQYFFYLLKRNNIKIIIKWNESSNSKTIYQEAACALNLNKEDEKNITKTVGLLSFRHMK